MEEKELSLEERMLKYRADADYKLDKNLPVIVMIDGKSFSRVIKKRFHLPFDDDFINIMNQTAEYTCKSVQGCKFAFVQSDEISFFIDSRDEVNTPFFNFRLCKLQSIIPSIATSMFNKLVGILDIEKEMKEDKLTLDHDTLLSLMPQFQFDCKAWNLPTENDVFAWFLYRQLDCIRNSKQQTAQTYCSHKELMNKSSDEQVKLLKEKLDINWNDFEDSKKFGRFIWKETEPFYNESLDVHYDRSVWKSHPAWELSNQEGKIKLLDILFQKDGIEQH